MAAQRRPSPQTVAVLAALLTRRDEWCYGYELVTQLAMNSGSLYPILMRLSERGLLEAVWETEVHPGRPPRHMYRLAGGGVEYARACTSAAVAPRPMLRPQGA